MKTKPKEAPLAIRLRPGLRDRIEAYAKANNLTRNGAAVALMELGLDGPVPTKPKAILARAESKAGVAPAPRLATSSVQIGRTDTQFGSRLKKWKP